MIAARARREARSLDIDAARAAHLKLVDAELLDLREEWRGSLEAGTPLPPRHVMGTALIGTHLWDLAQRFPRDVSRPSAHYRVRYDHPATGQNRPKTTAEIVAEKILGGADARGGRVQPRAGAPRWRPETASRRRRPPFLRTTSRCRSSTRSLRRSPTREEV